MEKIVILLLLFMQEKLTFMVMLRYMPAKAMLQLARSRSLTFLMAQKYQEVAELYLPYRVVTLKTNQIFRSALDIIQINSALKNLSIL